MSSNISPENSPLALPFERKKKFAIDFGTCNTYLSCEDSNGVVNAANYNVGGDAGKTNGIASIVLYYEEDGQAKIAIGDEAARTFGPSPPDRKAKMKFVSNFKPDIDSPDSEIASQARRNSIVFLKTIHEEAGKSPKSQFKNISDYELWVGIPCDASEAFKNNLRAIFRETPWGKVHLLTEAYGALCGEFDIRDPNILAKLKQSCLVVVDFGGGTCDFSVIYNGDIAYSWGDSCLGGRLIDDLFYQWVIDQSDGRLSDEKFIQSGNDYYFRTETCRVMKENFSCAMVQDSKRPYRYYFDKYELVLKFTWEEFMERVKRYRPSQSFLNQTNFESNQSVKTKIRLDREIDIPAWFVGELKSGFEKAHIDPAGIPKVLLAGGSSSWLFVQQACREFFPSAEVVMCDNPFSAVSIGIAKYAKIKDVLEQELSVAKVESAKLSEVIFQRITEYQCSEETLKEIESIAGEIFDTYAVPELESYRMNGGALADTETRIQENIKSNMYSVQRKFAPIFKSVNTDLTNIFIAGLHEWLQKKGMGNLDSFDSGISIPEWQLNDIDLGALDDVIGAAIIAALVAVVFFLVTVTAGLLAIILAPIIALGGVAALAEWLKTTNLAPRYAAMIVGQNSIAKMRNEKFIPKFREHFMATIQTFIQNNQTRLYQDVENSVRNVLQHYQDVLGRGD